MDIRKISVGSDYKSGAMHYIVGQDVLGGTHKIHLIQEESTSYNHDELMARVTELTGS